MEWLSALPWGLVIIGGPIALFVVLMWARTQSARRADRVDPNTPSDDPSKGL